MRVLTKGIVFPFLLSRVLEKVPKISAVALVRWQSNGNSSRPVPKKVSSLSSSRGKTNHQNFISAPTQWESPATKKVPPFRILFEEVKQANSISDLLGMALAVRDPLGDHHLLSQFFHYISLFEQQSKFKKTGYELENLQNHEGFVLLCERLREVTHTIENPITLIHFLKTLVFCEVDGESRVIVSLLQSLRDKASQLSLTDIQLLDFILNKLEANPHLVELRTTLVSVFETNLEAQLKRKNLKMMLEVFRYACHSRVSPTKLQFIADCLLASDPSKWPISLVCNALIDLAHRREIPVEPLHHSLLQRLSDQVDQCHKKDLQRLVVKIGRVHRWHIGNWYHQKLCEKVAERVIGERWSLLETSLVCWTFTMLPYVHTELLEYLSTLIIRGKSKMSTNPSHLLMLFSSSNYKPTNFDEMIKVFTSSPRLQSIHSTLSEDSSSSFKQGCFQFVTCCAIFNVYSSALIEQLFNPSFIEDFLKDDGSTYDWIEVSKALRSVRIECPNYSGPFPDSALIEKINKKTFEHHQEYGQSSSKRSQVLENALQKALGGSPYVHSCLMTRHGHYVDHAIVIRSGGYPVAINLESQHGETIRYVEDISLPSDCQLLLLQSYQNFHYIINDDKLSGDIAIDLRTLERLGYDVIPINTDRWSQLVEHERIPFLMGQIHQKLKRLLMQAIKKGNVFPFFLSRFLETGPKISAVVASARWKSDDSCREETQNKPRLSISISKGFEIKLDLVSSEELITQEMLPLSVIKDLSSQDLFKVINNAKSICDLLEIVKEGNTLEINHISSICYKLFHFQQDERTSCDLEALQSNEGFVLLCKRIRDEAPTIENPITLINFLKTLAFCEVDGESRVIVTLLQLLRDRADKLSLRYIDSLGFLLSKLEPSLLLAELRTALRSAFETNLESQLECDDVDMLRDTFVFASHNKVSPSKVQFIIDTILASNPSKWSFKHIYSLLASISIISHLPGIHLESLLKTLPKWLTDQVDKCNKKDLQRVLLKIGTSYKLSLYNQQFFEKVAERVVRERWPLHYTSAVCWAFGIFPFVHPELLEHLSTLIVQRTKLVSTGDPNYFLEPFSSTNYKPTNFEAMIEVLLSCDRLKFIESPKVEFRSYLLRFIFNCAIFNVYPTEIIKQGFSNSFLEDYLEDDLPLHNWMEVSKALRSVRLGCPNYSGPFPNSTLIEKINKKTFEFHQQSEKTDSQRSHTLKGILQKALGGSPYVTSWLMTRHGHYIDHAMVMKPDGFPVAIHFKPQLEDTIRYVEDISVPSRCKLVLLQTFTSSDYVVNSDYLSGDIATDLKTLERLGYDVIPLNTDQWSQLLHPEKIPFLMREIHQKLKVKSS